MSSGSGVGSTSCVVIDRDARNTDPSHLSTFIPMPWMIPGWGSPRAGRSATPLSVIGSSEESARSFAVRNGEPSWPRWMSWSTSSPHRAEPTSRSWKAKSKGFSAVFLRRRESANERSRRGSPGLLQAVHLTADPTFLPILSNLLGIHEVGRAQVRSLSRCRPRTGSSRPVQSIPPGRDRPPLNSNQLQIMRRVGLVPVTAVRDRLTSP